MDELNKQDETPGPDGEVAREAKCEQCEEYLAGWKRAQADYQNLKKDMEREKSEFAKYANERLLRELLPAIDQFSIALQYVPDTSALPDDQKKKWENWLVGVRAVQSMWDQVASSTGLERVRADGEFDPMLHDAVGEEEAEGKEPGSILKVTQDGWKLHGKVLRHAKVVIVK